MLTHKIGIWTQDTSSAIGNLHTIQQRLGADYLIARIVTHPNGPAVPYQPDTLKLLRENAATINLPIIAWAYVYPTNIAQQISALAAILNAGVDGAMPPPITDLILDAEVEWEKFPEQLRRDLATQLCHGIAEATAHRVTLHLSSFCNPNEHPVPLWGNGKDGGFLPHCASFMPQSYLFEPTPVETIVSRTMTQSYPLTQNTDAQRLFIPTVNNALMLVGLETYVRREQIDGFNIWLWDGSGDDAGARDNIRNWANAIAAIKEVWK